MKKTIAFLLALFMILGLFAGCKGGENTDESESGGEAQKTLTVGIPQSSTIESYTRGNGFTEYLEEKTGIKIKFYYFSNSPGEYRQQLALMCSANQKLPDVIVGLNLGHYVMNQYGEDGYFLDLTDLIEEYAPNYKKALAELKEKAPDVAEYASEKVKNAENGATYGMPRIMPIATDSLQSLMHINKTWLDKLGLEPPKTVEELRTVLQAFKDNDCNGNGAHDEIALFGTSGTAAYIINAFVYYQSGCFNVTDGEVWDPVETKEFRDALIYINDLVKDGLFDSKSFTITGSQEIKNLISPVDGPSKVGMFCGLSTIRTNANSDAISEFSVLPALEDATGKGGYLVIEEQQVDWTGYITKDCKDPELAMQFIDAFYDDETVSRQRHGVEGEDWVYYENGHNGSGTRSYVKQINSEAFFSGRSTWGANMLGICTDLNYLTVAEEPETDRIRETQRLVKETWDIIHNAREAEERAVHLTYTPEEYALREEKWGTYLSYLTQTVTEFMSGQKDPQDDAQWQEFMDTLDKLGHDELLETVKNAYARK